MASSSSISLESCFDALSGTPTKGSRPTGLTAQRSGSAKRIGGTPGDRFIPQRSSMDFEVSNFQLTGNNGSNAENNCSNEQRDSYMVNASPAKDAYNSKLAETLMNTGNSGVTGSKVLAFKNKAPKPAEDHQASMRVLYTQNREAGIAPRKFSRHIPHAPERILDAPELLDDYYLNLLDWSSTNILAVALGPAVYLWNAADGSIDQLMEMEPETNQHVTALSWIEQGNYLSVGTSDHKVQIWDIEKHKQVRSMDGHSARVGALSWNGPMLSSGGRDSRIVHHDVRVQQHKVGVCKGHTQEVCGLKWSPSGTQLASGGNDNLLNIWDDRMLTASVSGGFTEQSLHRLDAHQAAVKALAWCPWQKNLLASGGGTADRMIRFWNTSTGSCLNVVDTHSQVCSLLWSVHDHEIVSSHGYSHNQIILWKYPSMVRVAELTGHTSRVLHMAQSPDGTTVCTAAADETLRFWKILSGGEQNKKEKQAAKESVLSGPGSLIR